MSEERHVAAEASHSQTDAARPPAVRWSLLFLAAGLGALAAGYYTGRYVRSRALAAEQAAPAAEDAAAAPEPAAAEPPTDLLPDPDLPLPETADALIEEARRVVQQLQLSFPDEVDALEMQSRLFNWLGDSESAVASWRHCIELDPDYVYAYVGMAETAAEKGQHAEVAALASQAIEREPGNFRARALLADALIQQGRPADAVPVLEDHLQNDPRSQGFFLLGQAHFQLAQYEQARDAYEAAIRIFPDYFQVYLGLSQTYDRLGQQDKAQAALKKFRELGSPEAAAKRIRGATVSDLEAMSTSAAVIYTDTGRVFYTRAMSGAAESLWLRAADLDRRNVPCRQSLAFLCRSQRRLGEAIGWLNDLSDLQAGNPSYQLEIGRLYEELSRPEATEQAFRRACEMAPSSAGSHAALADLYLRYERNVEETLELARKAVALDPNAPNYAMLSAACRNNGQLPAALEAINKALELAPQSVSYQAVRDAIQTDIDDAAADKAGGAG